MVCVERPVTYSLQTHINILLHNDVNLQHKMWLSCTGNKQMFHSNL